MLISDIFKSFLRIGQNLLSTFAGKLTIVNNRKCKNFIYPFF